MRIVVMLSREQTRTLRCRCGANRKSCTPTSSRHHPPMSPGRPSDRTIWSRRGRCLRIGHGAALAHFVWQILEGPRTTCPALSRGKCFHSRLGATQGIETVGECRWPVDRDHRVLPCLALSVSSDVRSIPAVIGAGNGCPGESWQDRGGLANLRWIRQHCITNVTQEDRP
jgi:hypothetical protein